MAEQGHAVIYGNSILPYLTKCNLHYFYHRFLDYFNNSDSE